MELGEVEDDGEVEQFGIGGVVVRKEGRVGRVWGDDSSVEGGFEGRVEDVGVGGEGFTLVMTGGKVRGPLPTMSAYIPFGAFREGFGSKAAVSGAATAPETAITGSEQLKLLLTSIIRTRSQKKGVRAFWEGVSFS